MPEFLTVISRHLAWRATLVFTSLATLMGAEERPSRQEPAADAAWETLMTSGERSERRPEERPLEYFLRVVELAAIRRRELGLEFWDRHPNDPRRYQWLQLTMHLPPHYAKDVAEWARHEATLEPNRAPIDRSAMERWEQTYATMRSAFWHAPEVTDQERRALWFVELGQRTVRLREAAARGERIEGELLLADILCFCRSYSQYMLLDRDGKLIADTADLDGIQNLQTWLDRQFAKGKPPASP